MEIKHTIEILTKDIQDIEKLVRNLNNYETPPQIEIDLAMSRLRNVYDLLSLIARDVKSDGLAGEPSDREQQAEKTQFQEQQQQRSEASNTPPEQQQQRSDASNTPPEQTTSAATSQAPRPEQVYEEQQVIAQKQGADHEQGTDREQGADHEQGTDRDQAEEEHQVSAEKLDAEQKRTATRQQTSGPKQEQHGEQDWEQASGNQDQSSAQVQPPASPGKGTEPGAGTESAAGTGTEPGAGTNQKKKEAAKKNSILAEKFASDKRINERIAPGSGHDLSSKLTGEPIDSIKRNIGINDRFLIIREMMNGNNEAFNDLVQQLDAQQNFDEAYNIIQSAFPEQMEHEGVNILVRLSRRRYLSR